MPLASSGPVSAPICSPAAPIATSAYPSALKSHEAMPDPNRSSASLVPITPAVDWLMVRAPVVVGPFRVPGR